ncbi:hypothetical protein BAUCODRAFT_358674 [Baudoinia panamericana UAMH 10762]|uniref:Uncharacterized protein n=1 Tax=Baudoinia panamericana (strain UAMH 10762) TaxID=717646 RepID=M2N7C8_BAUPA|nr:uncharacterized protein BAUCODRAFT_358674 [Baudoinia panamericana UAMH 10762]EMC99988.1 hypothetical protein BAUCODRAFT_358674 [Baudoinia panamericana UAMH 10762]
MHLSCYPTYLQLLCETLSKHIRGFTKTLYEPSLEYNTWPYSMSSAPTPTTPTTPTLPLAPPSTTFLLLGDLSKLSSDWGWWVLGLCVAIFLVRPLLSDAINQYGAYAVEQIEDPVEEEKTKQLQLHIQLESFKLRSEEKKIAQLEMQVQILREDVNRAATTSTLPPQQTPDQPSTPDQRATTTHHSRSASSVASPPSSAAIV